MPFKSEAQRRLFHAMADRGEISEEKVREWERKTKNKKELPMHVKKEAAVSDRDALLRTILYHVAPSLAHGLLSGVSTAITAPEGDKLRDALAAGGGSALGDLLAGTAALPLGALAGRHVGTQLNRMDPSRMRGIAPAGVFDSLAGAVAGRTLAGLAGGALGRNLALKAVRGGDKDKEETASKVGAAAALDAFGVKVAEMPHWALPVAKHVAAGAIPAAALGYMASEKDPETGEDHSLRNALLAGAVGGVGGAGVDALKRFGQRERIQNDMLRKALKAGTWKFKKLKGMHGGRPDPETVAHRARGALSEIMPLYATPEEWKATKLRNAELRRPAGYKHDYPELVRALTNE